LSGRKLCAPGRRDAKIGAPCTKSSQCPPGNGFCLTQEDTLFPQGYCTVLCTPGSTTDCGTGAECVATPRLSSPLGGVCAAQCAGGDCREGYQCLAAFEGVATNASVCTPGKPDAQIGAP